MNFKRLLQAAFLVIGLLFSEPLFAQQVSPQNLSSVRVDELTDAQIRQFLQNIQASGLTESQLEQVARARGMSPVEVKKLRARVDALKRADSKVIAADPFGVPADSVRISADTLSMAEKVLLSLRSKIFGADLFSNKNISFEPNLRIAAPQNYQIGPDDEILIDIYGYSEVSHSLRVTPQGTINIPLVGVVEVGNMTLEQATARIRSRLSTIYTGLRSGNTSVSITVGNTRSIKVILAGEIVRPGTYTLPSVASVFNALYASGGPTENGSFRQVEVIRGGKKVATLDVYDFLLSGDFKQHIRLRDLDVIRVPTYRKRVELVGQVKRPGIFEMLPGETLADLIVFAGDFTERAYQARIKVLKTTETQRKISDVTSSEFSMYQPAAGDKFFIDEILDRFANRLTIEGAVFRPGDYELEPGLTLSKLIRKAEGLREDAFMSRGYILRQKENREAELISFNVSDIVSGQSADIPLKREDVVTITSIFDLKEEYYISVDGEVKVPGRLRFADGITLEDAIIQAGGFSERATSQRIEVSRRVRNSNALSSEAQTSEIFQIDVNKDLKAGTSGFQLQPFDIVLVRPSAGYEVQRQVRIEGEVLYPGIYTLNKKNERISDLVKRAGGFTAIAFPEGASLKRPGPGVDSLRIKKSIETYLIKEVTAAGNKVDTVNINLQDPAVNKNTYVGIDLPRIINRPEGIDDLFLEEGDILTIPKQLQTVKLDGQVLSPVTVGFRENKSFKYYISAAGGFTGVALKKRSYVKYANGSVKSTKRILFFNNYPTVKPGSEIYVPQGSPKRPVSLTELIGISSSLITLYLLINSLK